MTRRLDTDICIGVLRQKPGMVQRLSQLPPADVAVSMVTVYELFCGVEKAQDPSKERQKVERFISVIAELPLDRTSAQTADISFQGSALRPVGTLHCVVAFFFNASLLALSINVVAGVLL